MGFVIAPAPTVLGTCSLTAALEIACFIHLCICVFFVASVESDKAVVLNGVEVSPLMQCSTAAWFLIGIPVVIYAGVGACFRVESHLTTYLQYLVATLAVVVSWMVIFTKYGNSCETVPPGASQKRSSMVSEAPAFVCGVSNGMVMFWLAALVGAVISAIYLAWSMKVYIRSRTETELLRYQEPWQLAQSLADDAAAEQARAAKQLHSKLMASVPRDATWAEQGAAQF
mmetsp:Transcript_22446/g.57332  ORF Transcript_22446/g.57332 Transcript_22446/m.57332 type:complete len:228 (-) Transcript_22446:69-752(-)|eukprot:CAMPEP_0183430396 /NCGR_PEP_ID=MMETSP0370-20130417/51121_1 /TAXON_ID=268820 /ORGANISM="Peridinium aciculiferum, Strain PAER-2" /LENGTH=227 /DNA_ID=CAMNT_0025615735 /DNA_START=61 /DNA_END=744 /DNA_ORIENTATION=-